MGVHFSEHAVILKQKKKKKKGKKGGGKEKKNQGKGRIFTLIAMTSTLW